MLCIAKLQKVKEKKMNNMYNLFVMRFVIWYECLFIRFFCDIGAKSRRHFDDLLHKQQHQNIRL